MRRHVYYFSNSDIPKTDGLVFPSELQPGTYSLGVWAVALKQNEEIPDSFEFDAVDNNGLIGLKMIRVNGSLFQVDSYKYGKFYFRILDRHYYPQYRYVGKSRMVNNDDRICRVIPVDILKIEQTCLVNRFFFVGRVDNELKNND